MEGLAHLPPAPLQPAESGGQWYTAVSEEGIRQFKTYEYATEEEARSHCASLWHSWVLFRCSGTSWEELACGGAGMWVGAADTIRRHARDQLLPPASPPAADTEASEQVPVHSSDVSEFAHRYTAVSEEGIRQFKTYEYATEEEARSHCASLWHSWVLFRCSGTSWEELACGGAGMWVGAADTIRRHARDQLGVRAGVAMRRANEKVAQLADPDLAAPLHEAVGRVEATCSRVLSAPPLAAAAAVPPEEIRARVTHALTEAADPQCLATLVAILQQVGGAEGADYLVDSLVAMLHEAPPSDDEMIRLRALQLKADEQTLHGMEGYALGTLWLACLFVRTEKSMMARAKFTASVMRMGEAERRALQRAGQPLVEEALPRLLEKLMAVRDEVVQLEREVNVQEVSVRTAKGLSAGLSIAGSVMCFTPMMPVGVGLLASGAGVGVTTAAGDAIGQHVQKEALRKSLQQLTEHEDHTLKLLERLSTTCFPEMAAEDWSAARGAGVDFATILPEQVGNTLLALGGATTRTAAGLASRIGLEVATKSLSVFGALVSSGDFIFSLLTNSPNRALMKRILIFIESKSEMYRVWLVLLEHWLGLCAVDPSPSTCATSQSAVSAGGTSWDERSSDPKQTCEGSCREIARSASADALPLESSSPPGTPSRISEDSLRRAMMEAVASPFQRRTSLDN
ncbi:hypothetical protein AB1Y20_009180 [Prymnesium parvum]|uniref:Apolipoprotein L3 n=1 Tax=Prymnesium parvum TaxID=97485 RepID=A0AB34K340_PRYPA